MAAIESANDLHGYAVLNRDGDKLGTIEDFLLDPDLSYVRYAVISFGSLLALRHKHFAVPLRAMALDTENECFVADVDKQQLEAAQEFESDWLHADDARLLDTVYRYHGVDAKQRGVP
jgi:sporulation protein YlmC with PRC-barrel domain